jgi:hypothetical protein
MTALLLAVLTLAQAAPEPTPTAGPAAAPVPAGPTFTVAATVEPLGSADDRVASQLERALRDEADHLRSCLPADLTGGPDDVWFLTVEVKLSPASGEVTRLVQQMGTGFEPTDACLKARIGGLRATPPPRYPDRDRVTVAFRVAATVGAAPTP